MKYTMIIVAALASQLALAETIEREAAAAPDGDVEIVNVAGEVQVIGWDRPQVKLRADLNADADTLEFNSRSGKVSIRVKDTAGTAPSWLVVHVPRSSTVIVKTISASQRLENIAGDQRLQSVSGNIDTQVGAGDFEVRSVSGRIQIVGSGAAGSVRTSTVSGGIELSQIAGDLEVTTVNGAIDARAQAVDRARLKTTNGEIRFSAALKPDSRAELEAINGAVLVTLGGKIDATFDIETFNGRIDNCFGPQPQRVSEYTPGYNLRFTEGEGSGRMRIKTLNGAVNLCRDR